MNKNFNLEKIDKILVIQTAFLGDIVLTIPLLNNLKKLFPNKHLAVLTTLTGKIILEEQDSVDEILVYDKKGKDKGIFSLLSLIEKLHCMSFDWIVSPHRSIRSGFISCFSFVPNRWGFSNSESTFFYNHLIDYKKNLYDLERNLYFLEDFCDEPLKLDTTIKFNFNNQIEKLTDEVLVKHGFGGQKIIGIHTGSKWLTKKWPYEKFVELVKILDNKNYKMVVFGDNDDLEMDNFLKFELNSSNVLNLINQTDIKQLISYFRRLAVYVTNDSGPMHIAAALDVPIVAMFGPTVKQLGFFPYTKKAIVLEKNIKCRPCGKHGGMACKEKHFKCMNDISVNEVLEAIESFV